MVSEEVWFVWFFFPKNIALHSTKENIHPATPVIGIVGHTAPALPASTTEGSDTSLEAAALHRVTGAFHSGWEICTETQVLI